MTASSRRTCAMLASAVLLGACATAQPLARPDIDALTASEAVQRICNGNLSSEALVQAYVARAKSRPELNAFITLDEEGALRAARATDRRLAGGAPCRPFEGVPIVLKDNIHVRGMRSTAGTPALARFVPASDAPVVQELRGAGAVMLGKTNMHELAFGITGYNPAYNTGPHTGVRNAYDPSRMAGGSSAGTAVALAARMAPAGFGTDTGGSVRIPCALNGCAALRPSVGRYPQAGIAPISTTRDTAGPMAVSLADVELLDRIVTGAPPVAPADLSSVRLGVARAFLANLDADTREVWETALKRLRAAGVELVDVDMAGLMELNGRVGFPVALYEAYDSMVTYLASHETGVGIEQLAASIASPDVKGTYEGLVLTRKLPTPSGGVVDAAPAYLDAMSVHRPALIELYLDTFRAHRLDALVFPTVPQTARPATPDVSSVENFLLFIQNTDPGSNAGLPGLQVPIGWGAKSRLPVGLELDGPPGSDRRLIAIGLALERVFGRLPPAR